MFLNLLRRNNCVDRVWLLSESNNGLRGKASRSLYHPWSKFRDHMECSSVRWHQGKHDPLDKVGKHLSQVLRPLLSCIVFYQLSRLGNAIPLDTLCKQQGLQRLHSSRPRLCSRASVQIRLDLGKQTQWDSSGRYHFLILHIYRV